MRKMRWTVLLLLVSTGLVLGGCDKKESTPIPDRSAKPQSKPEPSPGAAEDGTGTSQEEGLDLDAVVLPDDLRAIAWDISDAYEHGTLTVAELKDQAKAKQAQLDQTKLEELTQSVVAFELDRLALLKEVHVAKLDQEGVVEALTKKLALLREKADAIETSARALANGLELGVAIGTDISAALYEESAIAQGKVLAESYDLDEDTQEQRRLAGKSGNEALSNKLKELDGRLLKARKAIRSASDMTALKALVEELNAIRQGYMALGEEAAKPEAPAATLSDDKAKDGGTEPKPAEPAAAAPAAVEGSDGATPPAPSKAPVETKPENAEAPKN